MERVHPHVAQCGFGWHCAMSALALTLVLGLVWLLI